MHEYTCFPKFSRPNSAFFSPKNVDHNFEFSSKSGSPFLKFPGNFYEIPKTSNFPEFQKIPKFRGKDDPDKKDPKFSIFTGFYAKLCLAYQVYAVS